jgi:hypothetical protein
MKAQTILRILVVLVWVSLLTDLALTYFLHDSLPSQLKGWRDAESGRESTTFAVLDLAGVAALLAWVVGSVGLVCLRRWATWVCLIAVLLVHIAMPFYGPVVSHGVTGVVSSVCSLLFGATLALAFLSGALKPQSAAELCAPPNGAPAASVISSSTPDGPPSVR